MHACVSRVECVQYIAGGRRRHTRGTCFHYGARKPTKNKQKKTQPSPCSLSLSNCNEMKPLSVNSFRLGLFRGAVQKNIEARHAKLQIIIPVGQERGEREGGLGVGVTYTHALFSWMSSRFVHESFLLRRPVLGELAAWFIIDSQALHAWLPRSWHAMSPASSSSSSSSPPALPQLPVYFSQPQYATVDPKLSSVCVCVCVLLLLVSILRPPIGDQ